MSKTTYSNEKLLLELENEALVEVDRGCSCHPGRMLVVVDEKPAVEGRCPRIDYPLVVEDWRGTRVLYDRPEALTDEFRIKVCDLVVSQNLTSSGRD